MLLEWRKTARAADRGDISDKEKNEVMCSEEREGEKEERGRKGRLI